MALKVDYLVRETGQNLRRNITLTVAAVLTIAVSLFLVGSGLMIRQGVQNAFQRWEGGIEFIIFMNPDATEEQVQSIEDELGSNPQIKDYTFVDQEETYDEFVELFSDQPNMVESVEAEDLPPSFRVIPTNTDADFVSELGKNFEASAGVRRVIFAADSIKQVQRVGAWISTGVLVMAIVLLTAASLLILNTIRMAMFARRNEIEIMKLVGATNSYIRIPFILEGLVHGLVGMVIAASLLFGGRAVLSDRVLDLPILENFVVTVNETWVTVLVLLLVAIVVGTVGSAIAVSRFLDV
ncbi:MAG: Cell division protein FtsX [Acidimicrobiales bacterium]|nr:MAG: ABC transporter permease [Actinomycetota bacterium]MBV6510308.1 Cell division protein FtsX [Acidimicrobiales bacterium]RIK03392.1 MAG: hypothetical protein DCC48_16715 [Acidobacteriota bacterium]